MRRAKHFNWGWNFKTHRYVHFWLIVVSGDSTKDSFCYGKIYFLLWQYSSILTGWVLDTGEFYLLGWLLISQTRAAQLINAGKVGWLKSLSFKPANGELKHRSLDWQSNALTGEHVLNYCCAILRNWLFKTIAVKSC